MFAILPQPGSCESYPQTAEAECDSHSNAQTQHRAWPVAALDKCVLNEWRDEKKQVRKNDKVHKGRNRSLVPAPGSKLE